jgi:hypothetical protein
VLELLIFSFFQIFYALLYGIQKKSLAQELKSSVEEAEKVISEIFQYFHGNKWILFMKLLFLGVRSWIENVATGALLNGFVQSAWNLSISMQGLSDFEVRQKAPHFIIQVSFITQCVTSRLGVRQRNNTQTNE